MSMKMPIEGAPRTSVAPDLDRAMRTFSSISSDLLQSYDALAERAQLVEEELERKVRELDGVKRHLEAVLASLPTGVIVRGADGRIARVNESALSILGVNENDLIGSKGYVDLLRNGRGAESESISSNAPTEVCRRDGSRLVLGTRLSSVLTADGEIAGSVEILDDQTEMTALSERLHAMDKMAALGTMAAGIAHEIRNPLQAVTGFASLLERDVGQDEKTRRWASLIVEGSREADAIIEGLLAFGNPESLRTERIDGEELLRGAIRAALPADEGGRWSVQGRCSAPAFTGDHIKLRQALRNLIANAIQAQPHGGDVLVTLERDGSGIVACVSDGGPGIPPALRGRIVDPFFTTRADGTGLGLALAGTIARLHGGELTIDAGPSRLGGAEISLRIPFHSTERAPQESRDKES